MKSAIMCKGATESKSTISLSADYVLDLMMKYSRLTMAELALNYMVKLLIN